MGLRMTRPSSGFTLVELMIVVAILAIVAAIAIPAYNGYIRESRLGAMRMNLETLRIAVEAFRLDDPAASYGPVTPTPLEAASIFERFGWRPEGGSSVYSYLVDVTATSTYEICAAAPVGASITCTKAPGGVYTCDEGTVKTVDAGSGCP